MIEETTFIECLFKVFTFAMAAIAVGFTFAYIIHLNKKDK